MQPSETIDILFFGDLVGKQGRRAAKWYLSTLEQKPDVVIANVENATHGFGLIERHYYELLEGGMDILTGGNHIWDKKDILNYVEKADRLLRPHNFPHNSSAGRGYGVFEIGSVKIGVINLIGQVFMGNYNSPWDDLEGIIAEIQAQTPIIFIDFHGEASAEKQAFAYHAASLGVSAFTGTHTHVQTADNRVLRGTMGYITDTGFNGSHDSVIGMSVESSIERLRSLFPSRMEVAETPLVQVNASRFTVVRETGVCVCVDRINLTHELEPEAPESTQEAQSQEVQKSTSSAH